MSNLFRKVYDDEELVQKLLSDELDWMSFNKTVPRCNLGFECDGPGCDSQSPTFRCASCLVTWYCSKDCQKNHCKSHKQQCNAFKHNRINHHVPSVYFEGAYHSPDLLQHREGDLDWNNQDNPVNDECQICLESKFDPTKSIVLSCRHQFCAGCIIDWQKGNIFERRGLQQADQCPICRKEMPVIEQSIVIRADMLLQKAKEECKPVQAGKKPSKESKETQERLCKEGLELMDKALQSKNSQRTNRIIKAEILTEMGKYKVSRNFLAFS